MVREKEIPVFLLGYILMSNMCMFVCVMSQAAGVVGTSFQAHTLILSSVL